MAPNAAPAVRATKLRRVTSSCLISFPPEDLVCQERTRFVRNPSRDARAFKAGKPRPPPTMRARPCDTGSTSGTRPRGPRPVSDLDVRRDIVLLDLQKMKAEWKQLQPRVSIQYGA